MATVEHIDNNDIYEKNLAEELFKLRIRRDARKHLEAEELALGAEIMTDDLKPTMVYDPLPREVPELIPGIMPESGTMGIVGETDTGKSLLALEISSSLLTGEPLWGVIPPNRTLQRIVYILGEHTASTLQGLYHRTGLPHSGDFRIVAPEHLHPHKALVVGGIAQPIAIDRMLNWTEGANLIIFDPLAGFAQGEKIENDNSAMRTLMDTLSLVAQKQGAACLVLHHKGKAPLDPTSGREMRRDTYASRGATAIEDSLTHLFYLNQAVSTKDDDGWERYDLVVRKFKGVDNQGVFKLLRDPVSKRNRLTNHKNITAEHKESRNRAERREIQGRVNRTLLNNPGFTMDTAIKIVADGAGIPEATLKRWMTNGD